METTNTPDTHFTPDAFRRLDESPDPDFYATDRLVNHLDSTALDTIERLIGALVTEPEPVLLDLMASWDSHLPAALRDARVVGLGLNEHELERNTALSERILHDLNAEPRLPFDDDRFDAVLCTVSIDYLTKPVEIFAEVARVLKPGGLFLVTFSNRFFPEKVVAIWREANEDQRVELVREFFELAGGFEKPRVVVRRGQSRPADDKYAGVAPAGDPVFAVFADRVGDSGCTRRASGFTEIGAPIDADELKARKRAVKQTMRCPHCEHPLSKWEVPNTPFTEWTSTYQFICFNDDCPHYQRGWGAFSRQNIPGSTRFMYDPDTNTCHSVPVLTPDALRASIVSDEPVPAGADTNE
jgi:SAM-dependent methyltransferase